MFERFTDRARATVVLAQEEARKLDHDYIGTEHLLLGLLGEADGMAARALRQLGINLDATRARVESVVGRGDTAPVGHIPFTPRAKKVLELSLREALALGHNYIGTEHILLGVVREGKGLAAEVLVLQGAGLDQVRARVLEEVGRAGSAPSAATATPRHTPGAEQALTAAEQLAGSGPMGSHHLLEALARSDDSLAAKVLSSLGIEPDDLAARIDELGLEDTSDLTAEEAAARRMEVRIEGEEVHLVLRDDIALGLARTVTERLGGPVRGDDPVVGGLVGPWQGVVRYLETLQDRLVPARAEPEGRRTSPVTVVQRAIQGRLRRRGNPS